MKYISLVFVGLFSVGSLIAQNRYESPHAKDGKTIQFSLPKGFFEVENSAYYGSGMFTVVEGQDMDEVDPETFEHGVLAVSHETLEDGGLSEFVDEMVEEMSEFGPNVKYIDRPHVETVNGKSYLRAALGSVVQDGTEIEAIYVNALTFGDYMVVFYYFAKEARFKDLSYENFKKIIESGKIIDTDKEDGMLFDEGEWDDAYSEEDWEGMDEVEYETNYINDLFETGITYYDILPDYGDNWDEPMEENSHLLCECIYKGGDHGSIKVFSGGAASNYPGTTEMAKAIQLATGVPSGIKLTYDSQFSNEDHLFKLYSITGGGSSTSVYTAEVNKELVFFVVDGGSSPIPDFKPAVRDFMLTMWVDYGDYSEED